MFHGKCVLLTILVAAASAAAGAAAASWWHGRPEQAVAGYHLWYHRQGERTYNNTYWLGVPVQKCPLDTWIFQELLHEIRPDVLVETGAYKGGSAYYFASIMDLMGHGRVLTVDIEDYPNKPKHDRISFILGSSIAPETLQRIRAAIAPGERVMVTLDSDHQAAHVAEELRLYSELVTPGSYLVVEDTHFGGRPILPGFGPGPYEAVEAFLRTNPDFQQDFSREKFGMTFNPGGWLKRVR